MPRSSATTTTRRRLPQRREMILDAAMRLFRERGYAATSINDICAEAGISGPGIYRHFASKGDVLVAALQPIRQRMRGAPDAGEHQDPLARLRHLVTSYVDVALAEGHIIALWYQEQNALEPEARQDLRDDQRRFVETWVEAFTALRPDLQPREARAMIHAVHGLINSVAFHQVRIEHERFRSRLIEMAMGALVADSTT